MAFASLMLVECVWLVAFIFWPVSTRAATLGALIKGEGPAVYYLSSDGFRHAFPNQATFDSWYPASMGVSIQTLLSKDLAYYPLGKNITYRPGAILVKVNTDPKVYALAPHGVLRWILSEAIAARLYGMHWNARVKDVPEVFFGDYIVGDPIRSPSDYSVSSTLDLAASIEQNLGGSAFGADDWMSIEQKRRAEQLTNVFENGSPEFNYGVIENIHDGRGYTAGRVGFTTATADLYLVVQQYVARVSETELAAYLPRLKRLADTESSSTAGLEGLPLAWRNAAKDPLFVAVQDDVTDELYYRPAMEVADALGIKTALGRAILYDAIVQHGGGTGPDSLSALVQRATASASGRPKDGVDESLWLSAFLTARKADLLWANDEATREVWAASAGRVDVFRELLQERNMHLDGPIQIQDSVYEAIIH